jgi:hypothetical protein
MSPESQTQLESYKALAETNVQNFDRFLSFLPSEIVPKLPTNKVEIISNYANPVGINFETLSTEQKERFTLVLENRVNAEPVQGFSYFPLCMSRCEGCRYEIETLRESQGSLVDTSQSYIDNQLVLARSLNSSMNGTKTINSWYEGGGTATLQTVEQFTKKWSGIKEIFGITKTGSITIEGNPIQFCNKDYMEALLLSASEVFGKDWEIRLSMGGFGFDITGRTEPYGSLPKAITVINEISCQLGLLVIINVDAVYGSMNSSLENHITRLQRILDLGIRNITLYGWEKSPENQKNLQEYLEEYFGLIAFVDVYAQSNGLEVVRGPSSLGGDWISISRKGVQKPIQYLDGRWNRGQDLIGITGYSLLRLEVDEKICFIRATTPKLQRKVQNLADDIRSREKQLGFTRKGLGGFETVEVYNSNLGALNQLHYSGKLYNDMIVGSEMQEVWAALQRFGLALNKDNEDRYIDLSGNQNRLIQEAVLKILSQNFMPE